MFKPESMSKINLFIVKEDLEKVSNLLYDLKLVQFFEVDIDKFSKFDHIDLSHKSSDLLKLRSTLTILKDFFTKPVSSENISLNPIEQTNKLKSKYDELKLEISKLEDEIKRQKILSELNISKNDLKNKNLLVGFVSEDKKSNLDFFKKNNLKFKKYKYEKRVYFKVLLPNNFDKSKINFSYKEFYLPTTFGTNLAEKLKLKKLQLKQATEKLEKFANENFIHLEKEELKLRKEIEISDVKFKFAKTENIVLLSGFIPTNKVKTLKIEIEKLLGDKYEIEVEKVKENAPVKLNNKFASKFEALLRMYTLPKYNEFDPTILMFFIFPLFFGFILGDVIYGLISLIVFSLAKKKYSQLKDFLSILQISAISSILFGFIYGEFMGFEFHGPFFGFFERSQDPQMLLIFAVIFGLVHVNLGLILGFINQIGNLKKAIYNNLSWIILEIGILLISLGIYSSENLAILIGSVLALLSVILIYLGHGFVGLIEVPSFFTNILSYARLMAVGLSSIAIAVLINDYTQILFSKGIFGILAAIILFSLGHIFNIVLGNFEGFLHTLRLHYVEFFTKFYSGGGEEFKPFGEISK